MSRRIPGPPGHWLLGSLTEFRSGMLAFYERCDREYGPVYGFRLGPRRVLMVNDPALIEDVLVTHNKSFRKHFAARLLTPILGRGLLLSEGQEWLRQRRLVQPAFSRQFAEEFTEIVGLHACQTAEQWRRDPRRDLYQDMTDLTVRVAAHAFLGVRHTADTEEIGDCLELIHADFEHRFHRAWNPPMWIPTAGNRRLLKAVRQLTAIIDRMIEKRRTESDEHRDALSLLLRARDEQGRPMPEQLLRDEVMTLLLAGHDTTANGLTWTWFLLAQHPEILDRLAKEVQDASFQATDVASFARKIVTESMRLYPPVYLFGRQATRPLTLGDYPVRRGDNVVMAQWIVHRNERYFPDPTSFQPDRWTPEFEQNLPSYAYFPFGGGPRVCIGKELAMLEATQILATLAREYTLSLESPDDVQPWPTVTLRPKGAVWANVSGQPAAPTAENDAHQRTSLGPNRSS